MPYCDVVIVGAGPAGAATAFFLARAGYEVVVLEREGPGRDKPCGEGIQAPGIQVMQQMGVFEEACRQGALFGNLVFESRDQRLAIALGGLAVARRRLDLLLAETAERAGALLHWRQPPISLARENGHWCLQAGGERWVTRWLVGADGARSWVRRRLGILTVSEGDRAGFVVHTRLVGDARPEVRVIQTPGAEIYTVPVDRAVRLVAWLGSVSALRAPARSGLKQFVSDTLRGVGIDTGFADGMEGQAVAPLMYRARQTAGSDWMLVGDAAAQSDPVTGLGISNALVGGFAAARAIGVSLEAPAASGQVLEQFVREHRRRHRSAARLARGIHIALAHPSAWRGVDRLVSSFPDLPANILRTFCLDGLEYDYALPDVRPLLARHT